MVKYSKNDVRTLYNLMQPMSPYSFVLGMVDDKEAAHRWYREQKYRLTNKGDMENFQVAIMLRSNLQPPTRFGELGRALACNFVMDWLNKKEQSNEQCSSKKDQGRSTT